MSLEGTILDWVEKISRRFDDLETHHAGSASPHYNISDAVTTSQQDGIYCYHVPDNHLGHGASFGNGSVWALTKGNGDMLSLTSTLTSLQLLGGMSIGYLLPFTDLSVLGRSGRRSGGRRQLTATISYATGKLHLHPALQQREFVIGDGLQVLHSFFVPRTGLDDPAVACTTVCLHNATDHPIRINVVGCLDLRGQTQGDLAATYDRGSGVLLAWNQSQPEYVRYFGASERPDHYLATCDEEQAFSPSQPLGDGTEETGDLTGALQFDFLLLPSRRKKIRLYAGFSLEGRSAALKAFRALRKKNALLRDTIEHCRDQIAISDLKIPSDMLTQGMQWAKANMLRPLARYPKGNAFTNDPGHSSHVVGRDAAWYVHGCDFVRPEAACGLLTLLANHQRGDGLIPEFVDAVSGDAEYWDFNINDNTPLFVTAVDHHWSVTRHRRCLDELYAPARKAAELILSQRNDDGLVFCTARGIGAKGICGWRNVLEHDQINGAVTEVNAECYDALRCAADLCRAKGEASDASRYDDEASRLRDRINDKLVDPRTHLYIRNIDIDGRRFTQPTVEMVFPLLFHVATPDVREAVITRLFSPDFMSDHGLRALPSNSPRWDPSGQSGCLGGVWPGATWWFAMGCLGMHNRIMGDSLERAYRYIVQDPKTYNTVPGQFNEWCDGQTLVNRGMPLSPWAPPRFIWAALEGLAGVEIKKEQFTVNPRIPGQWSWMQVDNLAFRGRRHSFFVTRQKDGLHLYTCSDIKSHFPVHRYRKCLRSSVEPLTGGMTAAVFERPDESILLFASSRHRMLVGPLLAHDAIRRHATYHVWRLDSMQRDWDDLGKIRGRDLQRIAVRIEPQGYALYRFRPVRSGEG
ncbi:MAG: hypothetical protein ABFD92_13550 [Planctomycetaceae bacterium]|nr:hypothetical protein [Planctomycetaceae bacterium]